MFEMLKDKFSGDAGRDRLYGLGLLASQLDSGQAPNAGPALKMLQERQQRNALREQMSGGDFMGQFSEQEQAFLATLPPEAAQQLIAQRIFAQPAQVEGTEINGQLVNPVTGELMGDFRTPDEGYRMMTPEEVAATPGLNPSLAYQISPDNQISQVPGSGQSTGYIATGDAAASLGLDPTKSYNVQSGPEGMKATEIGGNGTTVNVTTQSESAFSEETGKLIAKESADIASAGANASRSMVQIDALDDALKGSSGGAGTAFQAALSNMGIKFEGSSEIEAAQALISQLVPQQRPPGTGPMSDADLALFKQSLPRLINTPEGNEKIIGTMRKIAEYDIKRGEIARDLQLGRITTEQAFDAYSALANPIAPGDFAGGAQPSAPQRLRYNPATGQFE